MVTKFIDIFELKNYVIFNQQRELKVIKLSVQRNKYKKISKKYKKISKK